MELKNFCDCMIRAIKISVPNGDLENISDKQSDDIDVYIKNCYQF